MPRTLASSAFPLRENKAGCVIRRGWCYMFRYDAELVSKLLNVPNTCLEPLPNVKLADGEVLLWYPPNFTLTDLRNSPLGKMLLVQDKNWYDGKGFTAPSGYYAVQLRVSDSNNKTWHEQQSLLEGIRPAPVAVASLALALHLHQTGNDPLQDEWCRCNEPLPGEVRVELDVDEGRVVVDYASDDFSYDFVWLAGCRKL